MICPECGFDTNGICYVALKDLRPGDVLINGVNVQLTENGVKMLRHQSHVLKEEAKAIDFVRKNLEKTPTNEEARLN